MAGGGGIGKPYTAAGLAQDVEPYSIGAVFGVNFARSRSEWGPRSS